MIIHPLTPTVENGEIRIAARIEPEKPPYDLPPTLWFKFPEAHASFVSVRADGLALALLFIALQRGEDIRVRGTLSPRLAFGMNEYQRIETLRNPQKYHPIGICADQYAPAESPGDKIAAPFSGGVDSFYTVWTHIPQNEKYSGNALTHAIFVQGFDIGLQDTRSFEICTNAYRAMLREYGVELLTASTNVRAFDRHTNWSANYKPALMGLAHLLGRGLRQFYIPAEYSYDESEMGIASALQFALLSSESLAILNDGSRLNKFERIVAIAHVPATYNTLRVCYVHPDGLMNCGKCGKCVNTMTALEIAGVLQHYTTFPQPLTRQRIRSAHASYAAFSLYTSTLRGALAHHRYDLALDMSLMLLRNSFHWSAKYLQRKLHP